jgi:hypothetical protein
MEEAENLNGSYVGEHTNEKIMDLATANSLKSSLVSALKSSYPQPRLHKSSSISVIRSEDCSTELNDDDMDEDCERRTVANFQKNYLELGQWPEVPVPKFQAFKAKYRNMKMKLQECRNERDKARAVVKKYEGGRIQCRNCEVLKEKNLKTKMALEQAVQLSNLLLREVKRMEENGYDEVD